MISAINHEPSWTEVSAERRVTALLGASCNLPIAVFAESDGNLLSLRAFVADVKGERAIRETIVGEIAETESLAAHLGDRLLALGAAKLIAL